MSFAGGTADKLGGLYERHWTVNCALRVLRGEADAIEIEALGIRGTGIEFILERAGRAEAHQVKRQHSGKGRWSLSALRDEGVLAAFAEHLRAGRFPVFVSADSADELRELSARARTVTSLDDFRRDALNKTWAARFEVLCAEMEMSEEEAFRHLPDITVRGASELDFEEWNRVLIEGLFDGEPGLALTALEHVVATVLHRRLNADELLRLLTSEPYNLVRSAARDRQLLAARVDAATDVYVNPLLALRLRHPIARSASTTAYELLRDGTNEGVLVAGPASIGKTDIILRVIEHAKADGWPVLCMRVDRLESGASVESLGEQLELPGSPASVLDEVADGGPSLLVIDQLDAVSLASGRLPGLWEPVYSLIRQAAALDGMRVLIACRQFDLEGDWRLRTLTTDRHAIRSVTVEPLSDSELAAAVTAMGLSVAELSPRQRELLRVPLHLTLLDHLAAAGEAPDFDTATDLLDAFWERKQRDVASHAGPKIRFGEVTDELAKFMSRKQVLSMPAVLVESENLKLDADALVSEHVLVRDRRTYAFLHESIFDYVFARSYLAAGGRVVDLLVADEQDLFRRAQVRQLLVQQRDIDMVLYLEDLRDLLSRSDIRFHIKESVLSWLAGVSDPTAAEADVVRDALIDDRADPRSALAWRVLSQPAWFDVLDQAGWLDTWLGSKDASLVDLATRLIASVASARPDRVALLTETYDDGSPEWLLRTAYVVRFGDVHTSRALFARLLDATRRGAFAETRDHDAWVHGHELPASKPEWAPEFLAVLLDREFARSTSEGRAHPLGRGSLLEQDYMAQEFVTRLATANEAGLVEIGTDFFVKVVDADLAAEDHADLASDRLPADSVWGWRHANEGYGFANTFLVALETALQALSRSDPGTFEEVAHRLASRRDDSSQFLLYRALVGNPEALADLAAEILLEGDWRYQSGYLDQVYWATHELLEAIAPHLTRDRAQQLENAFTNWASAWERSPAGRRERGFAEFNLMSGLEAALSEGGRARLRELQRRFAADAPAAPRGIVGGVVQSPITLEEARRMDDTAWLRAIAKHRERWEDKRTMDLVGGARELASVLQAMAQEQPDRFASLGKQLPPDTLPEYIEHLLVGLSQPDESADPPTPENIWELLRHVASMSVPTGLRYLPRVVARFAKNHPPPDVVDMVADVAIHANDPTSELWDTDAGGGTPYYGGDVWMAGMNSDRGAAAEAIGYLLEASELNVGRLEDAVRSVARDPMTSVRACAAVAVGSLMRWRRDDAVSLIAELVACDDHLLVTTPVVQLLSAAQSTHWLEIRPVVVRMLASELEEVRRRGASLACVASLYESGAEDLAADCLADPDPSIRRGAAEVFATNLRSARFADYCSRALIKLFDDNDEGVRAEAGKVFWRLQGHDLGRHRDVGLAFLESRAFEEDRGHFLHALERSTADVSELTLGLAKRMLNQHAGELGDLRTHVAAEARDLSALLVRLLASRRSDANLRGEALDSIDRLVEAGAWGVTDSLAAAER